MKPQVTVMVTPKCPLAHKPQALLDLLRIQAPHSLKEPSIILMLAPRNRDRTINHLIQIHIQPEILKITWTIRQRTEEPRTLPK